MQENKKRESQNKKF